MNVEAGPEGLSLAKILKLVSDRTKNIMYVITAVPTVGSWR